MVNCYLCKKPIKVSTEEHYYDEKLKKRYHMKCFAGICRVCDKPVNKKTKHKTIGANVWHTACYERKHGKKQNPKATRTPKNHVLVEFASYIEEGGGALKKNLIALDRALRKGGMHAELKDKAGMYPLGGELMSLTARIRSIDLKKVVELAKKHRVEIDLVNGVPFKRENPVATIDETSWKAMQAARKIAGVPKKGQRKFEIDFFEKRPPTFEEDAEENPMLVTPTQEAEIIEAYERVVRGFGSKKDRQLIEEARKTGAILGTGPNVMLQRKNPLGGGAVQSIQRNPSVKKDYVIKDEFGRVFGTGRDTDGAAKAKALILGRKYMRDMTVVYG